jgi:hypothetical protein
LAFLHRELPGCMALVPRARIPKFMQGVYRSIAEQLFPIHYDVGTLREEECDEA